MEKVDEEDVNAVQRLRRISGLVEYDEQVI